MTQNKCLDLYLIMRGNTTLAQLKPNLYSIYWLLLSYKITSWRDTHPTSKFFVCAEGLISCYLSSLTVSASLHFLPCEKNTEHYFFQMPRFCLIIKHFSPMVLILRNNMYSYKAGLLAWYTAISRKVVGKNVHATIPKGNIWDMRNTLFLTLYSNPLLLLSFTTRKHMSMASRAIVSNFFEEQWTQNHPQYLSGLSRSLLSTIFLKIAVYK